MVTPTRVHLHSLILLFFVAHLSQQVCVDVPSETEAVLGNAMKLTCIFCMRREEVTVKTRVEWYYKQDSGPNDTSSETRIYLYEDNKPVEVDGPFKGRLAWNGSQDLQDVSIQILNVSYNDSGLYECKVHREFMFDSFKPSVNLIKNITLKVKEKASEDTTALYSEIMMYVLLVFLTFWLLVEMVYCYRKISKSDEQVQDTATNYLAIPSEQKDNPAAPVTE
ncbi:sodium channel regulatory subunit beta-3 isoform X1 [Sphaeramia orbicularis]|uniref:sodium channel regulatory subunit beta-3 isoform X1 n=1 Tax=Sphaeramia orbicularis TaxID=375764 RepID=UPI00117E58A5|nr:sodium channel subunit beta-3 isoform X1 [Sphaeramia orbicularis]XP_030007916.1 sodium channel subunit beta-3 isoform X1 [Sphaeramia orbicularis]